MGFFGRIRSYYRGSKGRDQKEFYDLESSLPFFDHVSRILCAQKRWLLLSWLKKAPREGTLLEIGGGIGTFARQLGKRGIDVVALDISASKTEKARKKTARAFAKRPAQVHHVAGDLRDLGADGDLDAEVRARSGLEGPLRFASIVAADVIEHVPDPPEVTLRRIRNVLTDDGRFYPSVPSWLWLNDPGHIWKLRPKDWEAEFEKAGFRTLRRRLCWIFLVGIPTPIPLAVSYELTPTSAPTS